MKNKKKNGEMPRYKYTVSFLLCIFMVAFPLVSGIKIKEIMVISVALCGLAWFIGENIFPDNVLKKTPIRNKNKYIWIFTGIFVALSLLSEVFSKDYGHEFDAFNNEYESLSVLIGYLIIFLLAYNYFYLDKSIKVFKFTILILSGVVVLMSVAEFFNLSVALLWVHSRETLENTNRVMLNFGNSNYYGAFCCMLLPFTLELYLWAKDRINRIAGLILNTGLIFCIVVSKSTLDFYLMIAVVIYILICERKQVMKNIKYLIFFAIVLIVSFLLINILSDGRLNKLMGVSALNKDSFVETDNEVYELKKIDMSGNRLTIYGEESSLSIVFDKNIAFYDSDNKMLDFVSSNNKITFSYEEYKNVKITLAHIGGTNKISVEIDLGYKDTLDFYIIEGRFYGVGVNGDGIDNIGKEYTYSRFDSMFTGRGYIWSRTIPKLKEVLLIGKGTGKFIYNYEQYDYVGLVKTHGTHKVIINRPHNIILQYCMDIGIPATLSLICIVIYVLINGFIKRKVNDAETEWLAHSSFISVITFCGYSMLNDSLVILSPYMWIFLGINLAIQFNEK